MAESNSKPRGGAHAERPLRDLSMPGLSIDQSIRQLKQAITQSVSQSVS